MYTHNTYQLVGKMIALTVWTMGQMFDRENLTKLLNKINKSTLSNVLVLILAIGVATRVYEATTQACLLNDKARVSLLKISRVLSCMYVYQVQSIYLTSSYVM